MQRLYSTFPAASPGAGLFILRMGAALSLSPYSIPIDGHAPDPVTCIPAVAVACCLILGYCTPFAAALLAGSHLWALMHSDTIWGPRPIMIALCISLVLLGPGAWSVDARLYGRRRVDLNIRP
jgi:uncharacterized membrane protein YphA (DoxX/SURF4 family)